MKQLYDVTGGGAIEPGSWFVEEYDRGSRDQLHGDARSLHLTAADPPYAVVSDLFIHFCLLDYLSSFNKRFYQLIQYSCYEFFDFWFVKI